MSKIKLVQWFLALPEKQKIQAVLFGCVLCFGSVIVTLWVSGNKKDAKIADLNLKIQDLQKDMAEQLRKCDADKFIAVTTTMKTDNDALIKSEKEKQQLMLNRIDKLKKDIPIIKKSIK